MSYDHKNPNDNHPSDDEMLDRLFGEKKAEKKAPAQEPSSGSEPLTFAHIRENARSAEPDPIFQRPKGSADTSSLHLPPKGTKNSMAGGPTTPQPQKTPPFPSQVSTASDASTAPKQHKAANASREDEAFLQEQPKLNKRQKQKKSKDGSFGDSPMLHSLIRAVIYIVCVLVVSAFAAWGIIEAANDVYAFVKDDTVISVEITPDMTTNDIAKLLYENNLIKYPNLFKTYVRIKKVKFTPVGGEYEVSAQLNYKEFLQTFSDANSASRLQVVVTIPEGYTVDQIIDYLANEKKVGTRDGYVDVINHYAFDTDEFRFLKELPQNDARKYRLEGYLFPDTYYIYQDSTEEAVIYRFLQNTEAKLTANYYDRAQAIEMSMDQVVTLASMVQAEAKFVSEYEMVSSVFHNRLNNSNFPCLESDATTRYAVSKPTEDLTAEDLSSTDPYNTYVAKGLPPGAICNPSLDAINYALYPANTDYYYFVADVDGHSIFSETNAQHEAAKQQVAQNKQNQG